MKINSISQLAEFKESESLADLGRTFYDQTECGVSTEYLTEDDSLFYSDNTHQVKRELPNIWAGKKIIGIKFHTIVEGYDAEFSADSIFFPCDYSEIEDALDFLEEMVDSFLLDCEKD